MKTLIRLFFGFVLYLLFIQSAIAQNTGKPDFQFSESVDTTWVNHYASGLMQGKAEFFDMVSDSVGNAYVTGMIHSMITNDDYVTIKFNSVGVEQWRVMYNGPGNSFDRPTSIALDNTGNVTFGELSGGLDQESDDSLRARLLERIRATDNWEVDSSPEFTVTNTICDYAVAKRSCAASRVSTPRTVVIQASKFCA